MSVNITALAQTVAKLQLELSKAQDSADTRFRLVTGSNCFFMLLGFTLLEAGSLRAKNLSAVVLKQFVVACAAGVVWYLWGYGLAYGVSSTDPNNFLGTAHSAMHDVKHHDQSVYSDFFFEYCFVSIACSIVSGAIGERMKFEIYFVWLFIMSGWVYPVAAYAQWSSAGWNSPFNDGTKTNRLGDMPYTGVVDAVGCGPIHMLGGISAFIAAWLAGPRADRFDKKTRAPIHIPGHNTAFITMGVIILWFGWYSFNTGGKTVDQSNQYLVVGRSSTNTCIASAVSGLTVLLFKSAQSGFATWPLTVSLNGVLAGLVGVTSGNSVIEPWAAFIIGIVAGLWYIFFSWLVLHVCRVDDPVDATAVHFGGGMLGLFATGLFAEPHAMRIVYSEAVTDDYAGVFMGGKGKLLGYQLCTMLFITVWTSFFAFVYFYACEKMFGLRYSVADEEAGLDFKFGGESLDYLTPLQQVEVLTQNLTALRAVLADGNPKGGIQQGDTGSQGSHTNSLNGSLSGGDDDAAADTEMEDVSFDAGAAVAVVSSEPVE